MIEKLQLLLKRDVYKNTLTLLSGTVLAQVIPFLIYPFLTRLYTPESFGVQSLFLTTVSLLSIFSSLRLEYAIMLPADNKKAKEISHTVVTLVALVSFVLLFLLTCYYILAEFFLKSLIIHNWLFFVPFSLFSFLCISVTNNMLNRNEKFKKTAFLNVSQSFISSGLRLLLGVVGFVSFGLLWGYVIAQWILVLWSVFRFSYVRISFSILKMKFVIKEFRHFIYFKMPNAFLNNFAVNFPVYVLSYFSGNKELGLFSVGLTLVQTPLNALINSLYQVLYQKMAVMHNQGESLFLFLKQYTSKTILISVPVFVVLFFFARMFITIVFGSEWAEGSVYLRIMLPYFCVYFLYGPLNFIPDIYSKQKESMYIELVFTFLRAFSMVIGVVFNNIILGLSLFSLSGILVGLYTYMWFFKLTKE